MPQMYPMMWMTQYLYFIMIIIMFMVLTYFISWYILPEKKINKIKFITKKNNWKW